MVALKNWIRMARAHWREHQPTRYRELEKAGKLEQALETAAQQTSLEMDQLEDSGMTFDEAWQATRETYLLPPPETPEQDEATRLDEALNEIADLRQTVANLQNESSQAA